MKQHHVTIRHVGFNHRLIDHMDYGGDNEFSCSCGTMLYPDCDMSAASLSASSIICVSTALIRTSS